MASLIFRAAYVKRDGVPDDRVTFLRCFFRVSIWRRAPQAELIRHRYLGPVEEIPGLVNCHVCGRSGPGVDGLIALPGDLEAEALRAGWRYDEEDRWMCRHCRAKGGWWSGWIWTDPATVVERPDLVDDADRQ